jgi:mannose-6-phosphate isomerase-like protein (cupin superfamily)
MTERRLAAETRPWGYWQDLYVGEGFRVKHLVVQPGHRLSLQKHRHRSEHWVVVSGAGEARINGESIQIGVGSVVIVAKEAQHRLINDSDVPLVIIETQIGACDEADIIRFEDDYHRV